MSQTKFTFSGRSIELGWWVASRGWGNVFVHRILLVRVGGPVMGTVGDWSNLIHTRGPKYTIGLVGGS